MTICREDEASKFTCWRTLGGGSSPQPCMGRRCMAWESEYWVRVVDGVEKFSSDLKVGDIENGIARQYGRCGVVDKRK